MLDGLNLDVQPGEVRGLIGPNGAAARNDRAEIRKDQAGVLEQFPKLVPKLRRAAGVLAGGEQQMVAIGRALMAPLMTF